MKSLILAITLIFASISHANSELVVEALKKPNTKINIKNLELAQTYTYSKTCVETDESGYCVKNGEHVYTLSNQVYSNIAGSNISYKTAENYDVKWSCWANFNTPVSQYAQHDNSVNQIANYPTDLKKEYRYSFTNQMAGHFLAPGPVYYNVKDQYQSLKTKLVENSLVVNEKCDYGDAGDSSAGTCHGQYKFRTLTFTAPVNKYSSFDFTCTANVPVDSKDSLNLTTEMLHKILNGEAFITE